MSQNPSIFAEHLTKRFGVHKAVDNVSFAIEKGQVLGFLGQNGAGKTTTMRLLAGFFKPDAGRATINGFDVVKQARAARQSMGYLPEGAPLYGEMTPRSFLKFNAAMRRLPTSFIDEAIAQTQLESVASQRIETLSKGYRRRVALAAALLHQPAVLILDEPTDGLDPNQKQDVRQLVQELAASRAIIISTHILEEVEAICSHVSVIHHGKLIFEGTPASMQALGASRVVLQVERGHASMLIEHFQALSAIGYIEQRDLGELATLTLVGREASTLPLLMPVHGVLAERRIRPIQLREEPASLTTVFQQLTHAA